MTRSNNEKGNQYHDEEGKFTSKDDVGGKKEDIQTFKDAILSDQQIDNIMNNYFANLINKNKKTKEEPKEDSKERKKIFEMSDDELRVEIAEHNQYFRENKIGLGSPKDFNGDLKLRCSNYRKIVELHKKYPIDFSNTTFTFSKKFKTTNAYVSCKMEGENFVSNVDMKFNTNNYYTDYKNTFEKTAYAERMNWQQKSSDEEKINYVLTHEYAHALHNQKMRDELFSKTTFSKEKRELFMESIKMSVKKIYDTKYNDGGFYNELSRYGKTNHFEWFAETFASLNCGKPTKAALCLGEYLKNNGYGG